MTIFIMVKNNVAWIQDGSIPFCINESSLKIRIKNKKERGRGIIGEEEALKALMEQKQ